MIIDVQLCDVTLLQKTIERNCFQNETFFSLSCCQGSFFALVSEREETRLGQEDVAKIEHQTGATVTFRSQEISENQSRGFVGGGD